MDLSSYLHEAIFEEKDKYTYLYELIWDNFEEDGFAVTNEEGHEIDAVFKAIAIKNLINEFVYRMYDETKKQYPFDYELKIKYTINGSTVTNEYIITNTGSSPMPFVIGGHPAFNCPLCDGEVFEDYKVVFDRAMTKSALRPDHHSGLVDVEKRYQVLENSDTINLVHDLFEEKDALIFDNIDSKCATLIGPNGKGVKIEYQDMTNLLVWSACGNADFVALEPWTGISTCSDEDEKIENKRGMTILQPDETASFKFKITMI